MPTALQLIHIITPAVLALPVLSLIPAPAAPPPEPDGIRAVTIKTVTPRRGWILLVLLALAATSAAEAAVLTADLLTANARGVSHSDWYIYSSAAHALGGLTVYFLAAIIAEWRTRWGDKAIVLLALLAFGLEVPNLVLSVIQEVHSEPAQRIFNLLVLPPSALRLLLLPVLVALVTNPIIRFEAADERTGLLAPAPTQPTGLGVYGTFDAEASITGGTSTSRDPSIAPQTALGTPTILGGGAPGGTASPSGVQKQIVIPKKLGVKKDEIQGISWKAFWTRLWKLRPYLWPSTSWRLQVCCLLCVFILICGRLVNIAVPNMLGQLVTALIANSPSGRPKAPSSPPPPSPWPYLAGYVGLRAIQGGGFLGFFQNLLWVPVQQYADREMQLLLFNHLLDLSLAFHTKRNTGEVLKIIDRGSAINNLLQILLFSAAPTIVDIVLAFLYFYFMIDRTLGTLLGCVMLAYVTFSIVFTSYRTKLRRQMIDRDIKTRGIASDVLTNWESVKYFTAERRESERFRGAILAYQETEAKVLVSFNLLNLCQSFLMSLGVLAGSIIMSQRILTGESQPGQFVTFIAYLQQLYAPLDRLGTLYRQLNQNSTDAEKLFSLLAQPTEIRDKPGAKDLVVTDGVIEFQDVHFSYDGETPALRGVSFKIDKGESMALVGESGSGKSTILRLLYRFYDINGGRILIDGQDISEVTQLSLRRAIGIVPQDSVLWNDTIGANIAYGKEGATDDEIITAAKAAKLHDRILTFPDDYSTIVGERGVRLSGGEKQRVSLARMFLKSPAILVLDEATSALDTETEREIQKALAELAKNRSSLSIAHRLSTIINSDQIVVMKDGKVLEHGTYHDLIKLNGQFAVMWKKQIFTEAEMLSGADDPSAITAPVAEAVEKGREGVAEALEKEVDEAAEQVHIHRASPPSTVNEHSEAEPEPSSPVVVASDSKVVEGVSYAQAVAEPPSELVPLEPDHPEPTTETGASTPAPKRPAVSFPSEAEGHDTPSPVMSRTSSKSGHRRRSIDFSSAASAAAAVTVQRSQSQRAGPSTEEAPVEATEGKRRKRLSSIKGFVRRISDQGKSAVAPSMTRSTSNGGSSRGSFEGQRDATPPPDDKDDKEVKKRNRKSSIF
ncbi:ATP-binding cassette-type vacuolar membrane transporter Hmt1 [Vanrija albida]|uniref:ATP-binding cassette-type vacuolar membrane transporter Hmt1 n=1 Tax=Vanrija albida TaxID=181172 RepID=A0ABR3Q4Z0_9TREE